jgi:hypothetical protein
MLFHLSRNLARRGVVGLGLARYGEAGLGKERGNTRSGMARNKGKLNKRSEKWIS